MTTGRRCPNAALPGSRFCGLESHQALEGTGSVYVGGEPPAEVLGDNGAVEEAIGEEALADGVGSPDGNDALVEEALEPAPEAAEAEALAADEPGAQEPTS
jgi:N utilization substance protein A